MDEREKEKVAREAAWAKPVERLRVSGVPEEALNLNVEGRRLTGPLRGFGQMWQKTYRVRLSAADVSPRQVIAAWKANFSKFWPEGNSFYGPITGIAPGEVAVLNLSMPGRVPLSTGVMVIFADEESFTFMTPQGHMLAAWITFSAYEDEGDTIAQAQALLRATDPLSEIGLRLFGHKTEDAFWQHTLEQLAAHFGVSGKVTQDVVCVDPRLQWSQAGNIWHSAALRTPLYAPIHWLRRQLRRR
jgi:hypothetical protein